MENGIQGYAILVGIVALLSIPAIWLTWDLFNATWFRYSVALLILTRKRLGYEWLQKPNPTPRYKERLRQVRHYLDSIEKGTALRSQVKVVAIILLLDTLLAVFLFVFSTFDNPFGESISAEVPAIAGTAAICVAAPLSWVAGIYIYRLFKLGFEARNLAVWALLCLSIALAECALALTWGFGISAVYGGGLCGALFLLGIVDQAFAFIFFSPADNVAELRSMLPPEESGEALVS